MRRYSNRSHLTTLTELNVTPLLDLAFVLLIIFMITTPLIENSMDLVVPTSSTAKTEVNPADVHIVEIDRNGELTLDDEPMTAVAVEQRLTALKADAPNLAVAVRPHKTLPVQDFISVMDIVKRVGISKVGVMTRPEENTTP